MRKHTKSIMVTVIIFFILSCFAGYGLYARSGGGEGERDYAVAKINGKRIMRSALDSRMVRIAEQMGVSNISAGDWLSLRQAALDNMAVQVELEKEIKSRKLEVTKEEIESAYINVMDSFPTREAFQEYLERSGLKEQAIKNDIKDQLKREKVVQAMTYEIVISEDEAIEFYDAVKSFLFKREDGYMINIATFRTRDTAAKVQAEIEEGAVWDTVLEENKSELMSSTPYDKPGELAEQQMVGSLEILKNLPLNKISPVIDFTDSEFGVVIKREKTNERILPFEEAKQDIINTLKNQQTGKIFEDLRDRAKIEILDPSVFPGGEAPETEQPEVSPDEVSPDAE